MPARKDPPKRVRSGKKKAGAIRAAPARSAVGVDNYEGLLGDVVGLLEQARHAAARAVNTVMTTTYWQIGRAIVEGEQGGVARAEYGENLLSRLGSDLTARFGRGFSRDNLETMRLFYLAYPDAALPVAAQGTKSETASRISRRGISETASRILPASSALATRFPLPWSHYVRLVRLCETSQARAFYETEALRGGWTVRQLHRQITTLFYERTALSRNKKGMLSKGAAPRPEDAVTAEEEIKSPLVLEFLGLKDEYSESDLEEALIQRLESFLLELGGDFTFVGRQRRLRVGNAWYRIDLLFFHRALRCLVVIDLKVGEFTHADAGQMHLYLNYAREHWTRPGENPPVGLILCAQRDAAVARYALEGLPNKVLAAEYRTTLPKESQLVDEITKTTRLLEEQMRSRSR
jgi:predicted nuclease of restriction endonuclease-like (RecB) superfamily